MAVTNYYSVNGQIIGEATNGVRTDYLMDALGSVTGTVNAACQVVNTYRYKPYGALLSKTGVGDDPAFGWVGTQGYKQTNKKFSDFYVRARHYDSSSARWTTVDPIVYKIANNKPYYSYDDLNPTSFIDPAGLETYTGLATCFNDAGLFCNTGIPNSNCPNGYKHGMTAAWPNVCYICRPSGKPDKPNCYTRRCDEASGELKPVKCGDKITVTAVDNPKCSFTLTIIDAGPNKNDKGKLVDLSPPAADAMNMCLKRKPKKCRKFDPVNVIVTITPRKDCANLPGKPCT